MANSGRQRVKYIGLPYNQPIHHLPQGRYTIATGLIWHNDGLIWLEMDKALLYLCKGSLRHSIAWNFHTWCTESFLLPYGLTSSFHRQPISHCYKLTAVPHGPRPPKNTQCCNPDDMDIYSYQWLKVTDQFRWYLANSLRSSAFDAAGTEYTARSSVGLRCESNCSVLCLRHGTAPPPAVSAASWWPSSTTEQVLRAHS